MKFATNFLLFTNLVQGFVDYTPWLGCPHRLRYSQYLERSMSRAAFEINGNMFEGESWSVKPATTVTVLVAINKTAVQKGLESIKMDPFGTTVWPSALAAAIELCDVANVLRDGTLQGLRMLEIGSGNGLCSLTAAALGANATATEFNPLSLELISKSLPLQDEIKGTLDTLFFDITNEDRPLPDCDLLVCADVLYTPKLAAAVASRCAEAISRGAGLIITSPAGRGGEPRFNKVLARELDKLAIAKVPEWNDAILPSWADSRWQSGSDDSVTQVLRYLDVPSIRGDFLPQEEADSIRFDGRWGTLRRDRARNRNKNRRWDYQLPDWSQQEKEGTSEDPASGK